MPFTLLTIIRSWRAQQRPPESQHGLLCVAGHRGVDSFTQAAENNNADVGVAVSVGAGALGVGAVDIAAATAAAAGPGAAGPGAGALGGAAAIIVNSILVSEANQHLGLLEEDITATPTPLPTCVEELAEFGLSFFSLRTLPVW